MLPALKPASFAVGLICALISSPLWGAEVFQAGAATSNITPPLGLEIVGGFVPYPSKHIHDELNARCLVLDDGKTKLAIVVCDLLGIHRVVSDEARKLIAEKSGIPREQVLISATHTHSASSALGKNRLQHDQTVDEYQAFVAQRIADGVARALNNCRPAQIAFSKVDVPEHVFNRRWHMKPGTAPVNPFGEVEAVKMNPPGGSPNLIEPAGPTDPTVSFVSVREPNGRPISVFATYSLHYVGGVGKEHISADYYGVCCEHLKQLLAADQKPEQTSNQALDVPPFVAVLANGTSGDINNNNFVKPRGRKEPYEQIRYVAEDVATKIHTAMKELKYQDHVSLAAAYREPTITWRKPTDEQKKWATETIAAGPKSKSDLSFIYAERAMRLAAYPETTTVPVQLFRIGDVCIGTMPCEVFCEIGLEFKARNPFANSFLVSLAHGYLGYLPTPRQHRLGGYETWIGTNRLEPTASDKLTEELLKMAAEVQPPKK
ncbi:Neutral/alkaline non-lysosomal ceramidase [Anatilimnocola aggregata]|uniref:Neutral/alkaline non-lysosomal ceramidase n=1 Tax=Anatilimnocola aggregata TaxID=2528021 RepID=A0A517YN62_9BACT|nr:neutral/alkaline non-lysosomal ceramidase N-terminal domain-containing protein [Anatilimnocola aggregata]QDU31659.1 Neutral/alkaline non-lysosomal ceramidase [Anatilimnocola aggregata]